MWRAAAPPTTPPTCIALLLPLSSHQPGWCGPHSPTPTPTPSTNSPGRRHSCVDASTGCKTRWSCVCSSTAAHFTQPTMCPHQPTIWCVAPPPRPAAPTALNTQQWCAGAVGTGRHEASQLPHKSCWADRKTDRQTVLSAADQLSCWGSCSIYPSIPYTRRQLTTTCGWSDRLPN